MNLNWSCSPETLNSGQNQRFFCPVWPWNLTDDLENNWAPVLCCFKLYASFLCHQWIQTEFSPETPNLGRNRQLFEPCNLEIWHMTLKNNRAPLLSNIKLCASFHHHMWIKTGVTVQKRLNWVLTSVTLTFDLWKWPFAWTSLLSLVISPEIFMMIWWGKHVEKGVTDRRMDWTIHRAAWSQLKISTLFHYLVL